MLTQSRTDIANLALMRIGQRTIQDITDATDPNAIAARVGWTQALGEVSREAPWNCLKKRATLQQLAPAPDSQAANNSLPTGTTAWAPGQNYAVNAYVTFGVPAYLYQCLIANTSSASFTQDLTHGYWFQTDIFSPNYLGPQSSNAGAGFEWLYGYALPTDFIALIELNGAWVWNTYNAPGAESPQGSLYEIYQKALYCNTSSANIKYVPLETDTTKFDSLFTGALVINLACIMATMLRKDDMSLSQTLLGDYQKYLARARVRNAGEANPYRYNIVAQSRFVGARYRGPNG